MNAEAWIQTDLNKRTITVSTGGLVAGKSIDDILAEVSWALTQRMCKVSDIPLTLRERQ